VFDSSLTRLSIEIDGWWFGTDIQSTLYSTVRITKTTRGEISENLFSVGRQRADKYARCRRQGSRSPCYTFGFGGWLSHFRAPPSRTNQFANQTEINILFLSTTAILSPARRSPKTLRLSYRLLPVLANNPLIYNPSIQPRCSTSPQMIFRYVSFLFSTLASLTDVF